MGWVSVVRALGSSPHTRGAPTAVPRWFWRPGIIPAYAGSTTPSTCSACPSADHPRIRGEHILLILSLSETAGSSPHTRGARGASDSIPVDRRIIPAYAGSTCMPEGSRKLTRDHPRIRGEHGWLRSTTDPAARIIPAYAGSTWRARALVSSGRDHPRIRGEHDVLNFQSCTFPGSSPHTRGAPDNSKGVDSSNRIIPAYAGSTQARATGVTMSRDHPRIRGEHLAECARDAAGLGSSPHTRGALTRVCAGRGWIRIIPAYAGSTGRKMSGMIWMRDHPRIRGEHQPHDQVADRRRGSSPHTRGALHQRHPLAPNLRIIPAYAGSTPGRVRPVPVGRDHPRIRGEHAAVLMCCWSYGGSSPHTRGARASDRAPTPTPRIIPAYAGSTFAVLAMPAVGRDHPRIRGEHFSIEKQRKKICGSSPHTRGALLGWALCRGLRRIIPAYAGSTDAADLSGQTVEDHPRIRGEHAPRRYEPPAGRGSSPHTRGARRPHERIARICRIIPAYAGSTWRPG